MGLRSAVAARARKQGVREGLTEHLEDGDEDEDEYGNGEEEDGNGDGAYPQRSAIRQPEGTASF